jgi:protoheme IX farnesyltransferase
MTSLRQLLHRLQEYSRLCKPRVSIFAALSALVGCLLAPSPDVWPLAISVVGVFLLACAGAALNQYQDRAIDALMERTRSRPIPAGHILPGRALRFALVLCVLALSMLRLLGNLPALLLGLSALLWYNLLYTYLKRKSAFATVPGALCGAIPPAIGWVIGGGGIADPRLWALSFLFFMWQVPHFWLLMLDRGKEYERAGLPTLHARFSERSWRRICFHWICALAAATVCVSLYGLADAPLIQAALLAAAIWITWSGRGLLAGYGSAGRLFRMVNAYMFIIALGIALNEMLLSFMPPRSLLGLFWIG